MLIFILLGVCMEAPVYAFHQGVARSPSLNIHHYEIPKKGEKRDLGRLLKNVIFPGIYTEYADTKDSLKTVKVDTGFTSDDKRLAAARATASDKGKHRLSLSLSKCLVQLFM